MTRRPLTLLVLAVSAVLALPSSAASAPPPAPPDPTCSPGPSNCGTWHQQDVTVSWAPAPPGTSASGCGQVTITSDTAGAPVTCTWSNADGARSTTAVVRKDQTPPAVRASADRAPDSNGWYKRSVSITFSADDGTSGVESCSSATYAGPDTRRATVKGSCTDAAGNTGYGAVELKYDARPPVLGRIRTEVTSRGVVLSWTASRDIHSVTVARKPGLGGRKPSTIYDGKALTFTDRGLKKGITYRYTITAYDEAGNAAVKKLTLKPNLSVSKQAAPARATATSALTKPQAGARLAVPPVLAWKPVAKATYYNVQLYRNGQKILTVWPRSTSVHLQRTWRFGGRTYRLAPATYRWYVWPGFGQRSANRYGKLLGTRMFVVTR
jgi:hypothetical protein